MPKDQNRKTIPRQPTDLAYCAGLFDGEGCICAGRNTTYHAKNAEFSASRFTLSVSVSMCDKEAIEKLQTVFPGHFYFVESKNPKWRGHWRWMLTTDKAVQFLKDIYPYLKGKKKQAALAMKFREIQRQCRYKKDSHRGKLLESLHEEIKSFNRNVKSGAVETERLALGSQESEMKFQSDLDSDVESENREVLT